MPPYEDAELVKLLDQQGVTVTAKPDKKSWLTTLVVTLLPWVLIIGFFVYINKRMKDQMGGGGPGQDYHGSQA
jgi:cell division protease FtsH